MQNKRKLYTQVITASIFGIIELLVIFTYNNFIANVKSNAIFNDKEILQVIAVYMNEHSGKTFLLVTFSLLFLLFLLKAFNTYKGN
ncbi:MAG: hypothetical protein U9R54_02480 [Bacteroidota bacterium]|nr:hypothetical protein [Bacteroidota bacterium]